MFEKQFIQDLWDVLQCNTFHITPAQFQEKYGRLMQEVDCEAGHIRMMDGHNEWHLSIRKVWCDNTMTTEEWTRVCDLVEAANDELEEQDVAIHVSENGSGGYFLYYMADGEPNVCEENITLDKLYKRVESLLDTLKK